MSGARDSSGASVDGSITIRDLSGMPEYRRAVDFQNEVWGPGFTEAVPASMQKVTQRVGGVAAGAFDAEGEMIGFVYGLSGIEKGELIHWSDILAVRSELRDGGIGQALKWHQRATVLKLGVKVMRWTYDPLESRNGWVNLERLGAVADEYIPEMYGASQSALHRGLGTDRLVIRWELDSAGVGAKAGELSGGLPVAAAPPPPPHSTSDPPIPAFDVQDGRPSEGVRPHEPGRSYIVPIPAEIQTLRDRDPELAALWREVTRAALTPALAAGYEVRAMERTSALVSTCRLDPPDGSLNVR